MKRSFFIAVLISLLLLLAISGCDSNAESDYYYLESAPGVRITSEALDLLLEADGPYTLTYSVRTS